MRSPRHQPQQPQPTARPAATINADSPAHDGRAAASSGEQRRWPCAQTASRRSGITNRKAGAVSWWSWPALGQRVPGLWGTGMSNVLNLMKWGLAMDLSKTGGNTEMKLEAPFVPSRTCNVTDALRSAKRHFVGKCRQLHAGAARWLLRKADIGRICSRPPGTGESPDPHPLFSASTYNENLTPYSG